MSYYAAGAWWTSSGQAFASQAEADAFEKSGAAGGPTDDEFARATGSTSAVRAPNTTQPVRSSIPDVYSAPANSGSRSQSSSPAQQQAAFQSGNIGGAGGTNPDQVLRDRAEPVSNPGLFRQAANTVGAFFDNPIVNPIGYGASKLGKAADNLVGANISGYIQDPIGQGLSDIGAPDAVQAVANPTGYITRTGVNANTGYGLMPGATLNSVAGAADNLRNDAQNTVNVVKQVPGAVANAAGAIGNAFQQPRASAAIPMPTLPGPSMTPQQILGMNTSAVRPSSAQQDALVQQMIGQSQVQSGYQDFNSPQYNQSRGAAMGYTSGLAGLANNNVAVTGLDSGNYNQSRGTMNQITGQLQDQAGNNVGDIQANTATRDVSRNATMGTATQLGQNAYQDSGYHLGAQGERGAASRSVQASEAALGANAAAGANRQYLDPSIERSNSVMDQLVALAQAQEGPSAAESLMLNAQERAVRNAMGNAASVGGGWRTQVTANQRALGQAATQQADIAAQIGAMRANEAANFRDQQISALTQAGGIGGGINSLNAGLAQSDLENARLGLTSQGQLALGRQQDASAFATSEADRSARIDQANQQNRLNSLLGAGQLQLGTLNSDTGLAQSDAALLAQIRQGNQRNALDSLLGAGNVASNTYAGDINFATNDASIRTQRELANQQNALNAMLGAANAANVTAGLDANIGTSNADRRATVDQNNRANSIAALQNAGVLSSATRGQDVQLSVADQQALTSRITAAANMSNSQYATQIDAALRQTDQRLRQQQFNDALARMPPAQVQQWLSAAGPVLGLLGVVA
jgi:hypothetical protein